MKVTNKDVIETTGMTQREFYYMKKNYPRQADLIKKGLLAELLLKQSAFDELVKGDNKKDNK